MYRYIHKISLFLFLLYSYTVLKGRTVLCYMHHLRASVNVSNEWMQWVFPDL